MKGRVFQHPASINFNCGRFESGWLVYTDLIETSKVRLGDGQGLQGIDLAVRGFRAAFDGMY